MAEFRKFRLLQGSSSWPTPAYDLDRLLQETDPRLFASLREEERQRRKRLGMTVGLFAVLIAVSLLIGMWGRAGAQPGPAFSSFQRKPAAADREHARLLAARGIAALSSGRLEDARAGLELSLQLDPHQAEARDALDRLQRRAGQLSEPDRSARALDRPAGHR
jgi:hypothetical protein